MSDADNPSFTDFGKFVPGFDFLQNLAKQAAGSAAQSIPQLPKLGNWVAPTLNVEELDKRIDELKAVQFWLDQNAMALKATIQALEVQKMTLATLKGMNFNMGDVANAFKLKVADSVAGGVQRVADKAKTFAGFEVPAPETEPEEAEDDTGESEDAPKAKAAKPAKAAKAPGSGGVVDPLQWWGALTQQFQTIAADAMKDAAKKTAMDATKHMATGLAKDAVKTATGMAKDMAKGMAESAGKTVAGGARAAMNSALRSTQGWPTPPAGKSAGVKPAARKAAKPKATARKTAAGKTPR
ncbi:PhaM family polyhydroxyalkanoate granule multifunctional regulatory protein [Polaromonas sp.]|uniref:PhaM family polyhydroxyalkanoate granule multifunctional regulatory protein n=1 Tax=Polaromonas sp. TaxID=1869339 RepID=UPI00286BD927|nr:PhaM family polyhydroxyalkanoate granule multifunctional regulatory protein [Polaromonas sp.]